MQDFIRIISRLYRICKFGFAIRLVISRFGRIWINYKSEFLKRLLLTDEASLQIEVPSTLETNIHGNSYIVHIVFKCHFKHKVNVWCSLINNYFLVPVKLPPSLNNELYLDFLWNQLLNYYNDLLLRPETKMKHVIHAGSSSGAPVNTCKR